MLVTTFLQSIRDLTCLHGRMCFIAVKLLCWKRMIFVPNERFQKLLHTKLIYFNLIFLFAILFFNKLLNKTSSNDLSMTVAGCNFKCQHWKLYFRYMDNLVLNIFFHQQPPLKILFDWQDVSIFLREQENQESVTQQHSFCDNSVINVTM